MLHGCNRDRERKLAVELLTNEREKIGAHTIILKKKYKWCLLDFQVGMSRQHKSPRRKKIDVFLGMTYAVFDKLQLNCREKMAKCRMINTKFWSDPFIQDLDIDSKYLYLYLLTNEHTNISGIYEITLRTIQFETGLTQKRLQQSLDVLSRAGKISHVTNWIHVKNFEKNQQNNPSVLAGIARVKKGLPSGLIDRLSTASPQPGTLNLTKLNLTKLKLKHKHNEVSGACVFEEWNRVGVIKHKKFTPGMGKRIKVAMETYTDKEICSAIRKYGQVVSGEKYYWTHKWTLEEFLQRGLVKFFDAQVQDFESRKTSVVKGTRDEKKQWQKRTSEQERLYEKYEEEHKKNPPKKSTIESFKR